MALQSNLMSDIVKLFACDLFKLFAARFELLVDFDGLLGHLLVCLLRAAYECEVLSARDTLMTVRVQAHSK